MSVFGPMSFSFLPFADALAEFDFAEQATTTTQGVPYDYMSVMHFSKMQFSSNGNPTLEPKANKQIHVGGLVRPSTLDYFHIVLLYCEGKHNFLTVILT